VEKNRYLRQCIIYIDMNMVRAGVVEHPSQWEYCGYNEIQNPRKRKGIIDFDRLMGLLGFENYDDLKDAHYRWVESAIQTGSSGKEDKWSQSIAVGSESFIEKIRGALGFRAKGRKIVCADDTFELREVATAYGKSNHLDSGNTFLWNQQPPPLIGQFLHEN
jgi:putative transposase